MNKKCETHSVVFDVSLVFAKCLYNHQTAILDVPEHVCSCGACLRSCNCKRGGAVTCHVLLQLVSDFTLKLTSQCLSGGRTIQRQRIAQQLSMAQLSVRLGHHVDETSQSYTLTGRAPISRLQLRWKSNIHIKCCSFYKVCCFSIPLTYFNSDNNLQSISLTPPLFFLAVARRHAEELWMSCRVSELSWTE